MTGCAVGPAWMGLQGFTAEARQHGHSCRIQDGCSCAGWLEVRGLAAATAAALWWRGRGGIGVVVVVVALLLTNLNPDGEGCTAASAW